MEKFLKISLQDGISGPSEISQQRDYATFANMLADFFRTFSPPSDRSVEFHTMSITVCDQVDKIHFLESDQPLIISISA